MKKTQFTDAVRNIQKRWVSFLSVIVIALRELDGVAYAEPVST